MKRLLLLFTALPLLVTACFNHTASLSVDGEGIRAIARELQRAAAPVPQVQPNALYGERLALQQLSLNEAAAGEGTTEGESTADNKIILTVSLTGDVRGDYPFPVDESRLLTNGESYTIDNLQVGATVTVRVSVQLGNTRYVQEEAKTITLEAGTNSVDITLVEAEEPLPQLEGKVTTTGTSGTVSVGDYVAFQYEEDPTYPTDYVIHVSGLREDDVTVLNGSYTNGEITSSPGGQIELQFKNAGQYKVAAWATAAGYAPTEPQTYTINVNMLTLAGTIEASPTSGTELTWGETVTFTYSGSETGTTIHLTLDKTAGVKMNGNQITSTTVTGTSPVTLTFEPTSSEANPADKTYTITNAYASLTNYNNSTAAADFTYTVNFPQLNGNFTQTPETDITAGDAVTFRHSDAGATISLEIRKTGGGAVTASDVAVSGGTLSNGTVTAAGSPANSVTLTFNTTGSYTVTPSATKANHKPQTGNAFTVTVNIKFVQINGATVRASIGENGGPFKNASAQNPVMVNSFEIAETELTYAQWKEVYDWATTQAPNRYTFANPGCEGSGRTAGAAPTGSMQPVVNVSWRDAVVWCNAASEKDGLTPVYVNGSYVPVRDSSGGEADSATVNASENGYRLPTEAEWEFAARGGNPNNAAWSYTYAGVDTDPRPGGTPLGNYAVYNTNSTADVKSKRPNSAGLYDMSGNVWEWCWDTYAGSLRVVRGGCWLFDAASCAVASRDDASPYDHIGNGFRLVRVARSGN